MKKKAARGAEGRSKKMAGKRQKAADFALEKEPLKALSKPENHSFLPLFFLLLSFALCLLLPYAALRFLGADADRFLTWYIALLLPGCAAYPLAARLFHRHAALSFLFSLPLGLLIIGLALFILAHISLLPLTASSIYLLTGCLALAAWLWPDSRRQARLSLRSMTTISFTLFTAAFLGFALLYMSFVRGSMPAARGLEKFMDYGFMQTIWRSTKLPAADMWFAGSGINYYYFGQYLYTMIGKACGLPPPYSYNLGMASTFAYMLTLSFGVGYLIIDMGRKRSKILPFISGSLVAFLTTFSGNAHDFFIGPQAWGQKILLLFGGADGRFGDLQRYAFSDATRYIGYNPPTQDKTIHEFPYYSFMVADLHAHVITTVFVLLAIALILLLVERQDILQLGRYMGKFTTTLSLNRPSLLGRALSTYFFNLQLPFIALLLGTFMQSNYWDFPIYFVVLAFFLLYASGRGFARPDGMALSGRIVNLLPALLQLLLCLLPYVKIVQADWQLLALSSVLTLAAILFQIFPGSYTLSGFYLVLSFFIAHAIALPFNLHFAAISKEIRLAQAHTPFFQLFVLYGPQTILALIFAAVILFLAWQKRKHKRLELHVARTAHVQIEAAAKPAASGFIQSGKSDRSHAAENSFLSFEFEQNLDSGSQSADDQRPLDGEKLDGNKPLPQGVKKVLPQRYLKQLEKSAKNKRRINEKNKNRLRSTQAGSPLWQWIAPHDMIIFLLLICAFGLILIPELLYVKDIYEHSYARANTMFKFTYQAFIMLSIAMGTAVLSLLQHLCRIIATRRAGHMRAADLSLKAETYLLDQTAGIRLEAKSQFQQKIKMEESFHRVRQQHFSRATAIALLCAIVLCLSLLVPGSVYPFIASPHWLPALKQKNYKGLDATAWMLTDPSADITLAGSKRLLADDLGAINWLNAKITGQPIILEAAGSSYTDHGRISAYTGLPTVIGWQTHEWLWRSSQMEPQAFTTQVAPREADVKAIYESKSASDALLLLKAYHVQYLIIGDIERSSYSALSEEILRSLGEEVFSSASCSIIKIPN